MLHCPVTPAHTMIEVAEGLYQCPDCGAGPAMYWALSHVEEGTDFFAAQCITYRADLAAYVVTFLSWRTEKSRRLPGTLQSTLLAHLVEPEEKRNALLPCVALKPRKLVLKPKMFPKPQGLKERYGRTAGQPGTSGARPSPGGSTGSSRRRRLQSGG